MSSTSAPLPRLAAVVRLAAVAVLLVLALPSVRAQEDEDVPRCKHCDSTGTRACSEHRADECLLESEVHYCSEFADCTTCGGLGVVDCVKCERPDVLELLEKRKRAFDRAAKGPRIAKIDEEMKHLGRSLRKCETEHFVVVWEMHGLKVDRKRLSPHQTMHLYARRLEELFDLYVKTLQVSEREFQLKSRLFVWEFVDDHRHGALVFCGGQADLGIKLMGSDPNYSVCGHKRFFQDDEALHHNVMHSMTHLLFSHERPAAWVGNRKGGWIDEGLAHWMEHALFGTGRTYCFEEVATGMDFRPGKFPVEVRKMVAMDRAPALAEVVQQNTDTLTAEQRMVSMSYVDYLLQLDPKAFTRLGKALRRKVDLRDALKETFDLNPLSLEERWKEWVLATYPKK